MVFDKINDGREWFLNFKPLHDKTLPQMYRDNIDFNPNMGEWFLFRHIKYVDHQELISRPILGMFINWDIWDQALVIRFVEETRAWQYSNKYKSLHDGKTYEWTFIHQPKQIEELQFWTDDINILGQWKIKPSIKELKIALSRCDQL